MLDGMGHCGNTPGHPGAAKTAPSCSTSVNAAISRLGEIENAFGPTRREHPTLPSSDLILESERQAACQLVSLILWNRRLIHAKCSMRIVRFFQASMNLDTLNYLPERKQVCKVIRIISCWHHCLRVLGFWSVLTDIEYVLFDRQTDWLARLWYDWNIKHTRAKLQSLKCVWLSSFPANVVVPSVWSNTGKLTD